MGELSVFPVRAEIFSYARKTGVTPTAFNFQDYRGSSHIGISGLIPVALDNWAKFLFAGIFMSEQFKICPRSSIFGLGSKGENFRL